MFDSHKLLYKKRKEKENAKIGKFGVSKSH